MKNENIRYFEAGNYAVALDSIIETNGYLLYVERASIKGYIGKNIDNEKQAILEFDKLVKGKEVDDKIDDFIMEYSKLENLLVDATLEKVKNSDNNYIFKVSTFDGGKQDLLVEVDEDEKMIDVSNNSNEFKNTLQTKILLEHFYSDIMDMNDVKVFIESKEVKQNESLNHLIEIQAESELNKIVTNFEKNIPDVRFAIKQSNYDAPSQLNEVENDFEKINIIFQDKYDNSKDMFTSFEIVLIDKNNNELDLKPDEVEKYITESFMENSKKTTNKNKNR